MTTNRWVGGLLATTATAGLLVAAPGIAFADDPGPDTDPGPVTITLTPEESAKLCDVRIPRILERISSATTRINSDEKSQGSVKFIRERATKLRAEGREDAAKLLDERADRRAGRVELLDALRERVQKFDTEHCGS